MYQRILQLLNIIEKKSIFLLGPRQTGKSTLIRSQVANALEIAAGCSTQILNYTKIAGDAEVKRTTVMDYFQLLRDTLLAYDLPAWEKTKKRKPITSAKFFLFDLGVARFLSGAGSIQPKNPAFGVYFEHFLFHELRSALDYGYIKTLHYWRSTSGFEVDFIINEEIAVEVKAATTVRHDDCKGLKALCEEAPMRAFLVANIERAIQLDGVLALPWQEFLQRLWQNQLY